MLAVLHSAAWTQPTAATGAQNAAGLNTGAVSPGIETPAVGAKAAATGTQSKEAEMNVTIQGQSQQKLTVNKFDPPAAFALEDIQNFPEERLQPVLNNPITFEEGKDFSVMMDFQEDQFVHPWLPEIAQAPFLRMKTPATEKTQSWTFTVIDQAGATISKQEGHGVPPNVLLWNGDDSQRDHAAVDTVYIPQLMTVDKEGYHHTFMGQPVQFSTLIYKNGSHQILELSSKRLFHENKPEFSKEAPSLLEKVCDILRQDGHTPLAVLMFGNDDSLAKSRQDTLTKYFQTKLVLSNSDMLSGAISSSQKRGEAVAIMTNAGGSGL
jgi:hypothetical protein